MTKPRNVLLHVNNWAKLGGIECTVMDLTAAFPEFFHILLTLNRSVEDYEYIAYLRERGVRYMCCGGPPMVSRRALSEIKPFAVFLHNTRGDLVQKGCLEPYRVIAVHHNVVKPVVNANLDWFVSDYVRSGYDTSRMSFPFTQPHVFPAYTKQS